MDQIQKDMVAAMKGKEEARLETLRMMKSALQQFQIDTMKPHDESTELQVLSTLVKQRKESADMFRKGNRLELAEKEESEIKMIETYMPSSPTEEELDAAVAAADHMALGNGQQQQQKRTDWRCWFSGFL